MIPFDQTSHHFIVSQCSARKTDISEVLVPGTYLFQLCHAQLVSPPPLVGLTQTPPKLLPGVHWLRNCMDQCFSNFDMHPLTWPLIQQIGSKLILCISNSLPDDANVAYLCIFIIASYQTTMSLPVLVLLFKITFHELKPGEGREEINVSS